MAKEVYSESISRQVKQVENGKGYTTEHTSKQYSCPKMLEWTGFIIASSSKTRSKASAALLGESRDSWEWDSLKLCINRVLEREGEGIYALSEFR